MRARLKKCGGDASVRMPTTLLTAAGLRVGQTVEMYVEQGRIVIACMRRPHFNLDELLAHMKPETFHEPVDFGPRVGNEVW